MHSSTSSSPPPPPPSGPINDGNRQLLANLQDATQNGSLDEVQRVLATWNGPLDRSTLISNLVIAVQKGYANLTDLYLSQRHLVELPIEDAIAQAIQARSSDILDIFLSHGWNINEPVGALKPSALGYATCDERLTDWFLAHGADPNAGFDHFTTAMSFAVAQAPLTTIRKLFESGGDASCGQLFHYALSRETIDKTEVLQLLKEMGAPIDQLLFGGNIPPWYALYRITGLGAPLHEAARLGSADAVSALLALGAKPSVNDLLGRKPVDIAKQLGHQACVEVLERALM